MMKPFKIRLLSYLLHHANRSVGGKLEKAQFYPIKERLLNRWGSVTGHDLQVLPGKECYCGDGWHHFFYDNHWQKDVCWKCNGTKWYKAPRYVLLERWRMGRFTFHRPISSHSNPNEVSIPVTVKPITGYIDHAASAWGGHALGMLMLLFAPDQFRVWARERCRYWPCYWWLPVNWLKAIGHFASRRSRSAPLVRAREKMLRWFRPKAKPDPWWEAFVENDDLPF